jgi:hypothetical protein
MPELPKDCSMVLGEDRHRCGAATRWMLHQAGELESWPICNVHRSVIADQFVATGGRWLWLDRVNLREYPAHAGCLRDLASVGQSQTCQGAGSVSRVVCPLTPAPGSGSP